LFRYGRSVLSDLFRQGGDPHRYTAALLLGLTLDQFEKLPREDQKRHRQRAKAINFGTPGGLGTASLVSYAKQSYGVELTINEAKQFRQRLITEIYPELGVYLKDEPFRLLADNLQCTPAEARRLLGRRGQLATATRIVTGCTEAPDGDEYEHDLIEHIWSILQQLNRNQRLIPRLQAQEASSELARRIFCGHAMTISGRLRGHVSFSQRMNTPFQSLAADGNKLALFRLLRLGFQVCGFVHDEMLILIPDGTDYDVAVGQVQQILEDSMQEFTPGIPIRTEYLLADRWYKDVDDQPMDELGRILPYRKQHLS
jgi:DNA polymerase I-like protein with 3'-5' exonuclease and polymerase domains